MRRTLSALSLVALALFAAACTSASAPGWTYAPPTEAPSPAASADGSPAASDAAPSDAAPSDGGSAAPSDGAGGDTVQVSAINIAFEQTEISAPADAAFTIAFENKEAVPHNVEIKDAGGMSMFKGEIVTGPTTVNYQVPAPPAGTYQFVCTVHPNMVGTLTVGG
jgi:plastocyanin